jgi:hemerythrin-like domain-containing protein
MRSDHGELAALGLPLRQMIDTEVTQHFGFEENELFPRLRAAGDGDIADLLTQEHADIRELGSELRPIVVALAGGALAPAQHTVFKRLAFELIERMVAHIQKETMGLLPLLEDLLDEDTDRELALRYACAR